jgi:Ice-binding-like/Bacterial Ig-like domain
MSTVTHRNSILFVAIATLAAGCAPLVVESTGGSGSGGSDPAETTLTAPIVVFNTPNDGATGAPTNGNASVTFSEPMECASLTTESFTLTYQATDMPVDGRIVCTHANAMFWPRTMLPEHTAFTATISAGAQSLDGGARLGSSYSWTFTTGTRFAAGMAVKLGAAGQYTVLTGAWIAMDPTATITGDVGVSGLGADTITGVSLTEDTSDVFSTAPQVKGEVFTGNDEAPTPSNLDSGIADMESAFQDAAARAPDVSDLDGGNVGGMTLTAGVYKWDSSALIQKDLTLLGDENDVWIFQIGQDLILTGGAHVKLAGGALPKNVFWQVDGAVNVGVNADLVGIALTRGAIVIQTGAVETGRFLTPATVEVEGDVTVAASL